MKSKVLITGTMAVLAAILALVILRPQFMISPGRLSKAHATLGQECFACHQPFSGASSQKCLSCHEIEKDGRIATNGAPTHPASRQTPFHHALATNNCVACHTEHEGVRVYRGAVAFSHGALESSVRDACGACHERPNDRVHQASAAECQSCHAEDKWKPTKFDHSKFFALDSRHNVACTTCHSEESFQKYTCYGCHQHSRDAMAALHRREGVSNLENCVACHRNSGEDGERNDD